MGYSGAGGKLIDEKNQKKKISRHCPFKEREIIHPYDILQSPKTAFQREPTRCPKNS
jgi:hypothetical protein